MRGEGERKAAAEVTKPRRIVQISYENRPNREEAGNVQNYDLTAEISCANPSR